MSHMLSHNSLFVTLVPMFLAAAFCSADTTVDIAGLLTGPDGQPIKDALVVLVDISQNGPEAHSHQWEMRTGSDGRFSLTVPLACYDAFFTAFRFEPYAQRVCLRYDSKPFLKIKMKIAKNAWVYLD